jgi:hypothetical protein
VESHCGSGRYWGNEALDLVRPNVKPLVHGHRRPQSDACGGQWHSFVYFVYSSRPLRYANALLHATSPLNSSFQYHDLEEQRQLTQKYYRDSSIAVSNYPAVSPRTALFCKNCLDTSESHGNGRQMTVSWDGASCILVDINRRFFVCTLFNDAFSVTQTIQPSAQYRKILRHAKDPCEVWQR